MEDRLRFLPKPDAFCMTLICWQPPGQDPLPITEVYVGPEEYSSRGPFFGWSYRCELYQSGSEYTLLVFTYKLPSGATAESERIYDSVKLFRGANNGQSWTLLAERSIERRLPCSGA